MKTFREIREAVGAGKYSDMNLKAARKLMGPAKNRKDGIMRIMKGMKVSYKQATKFHDDVMKADMKSEETNEGSGKPESWEAGYKRRVVRTTKPEHKEKGMNWRIKGKDRPEISIRLYKEKPSQAEFNKQMKRVAGHEFGG
jgi:hypothetical protein|tara:strand:- start:270 stop:692 length:423 start_codon:yes stop_codon:yes gene_type:complete